MSDQEVHSRDLVVQKMTKDGLVQENKTKGTNEHVSKRTIDASYDKDIQDSNFKTRTGDVKVNSSRRDRQRDHKQNSNQERSEKSNAKLKGRNSSYQRETSENKQNSNQERSEKSNTKLKERNSSYQRETSENKQNNNQETSEKSNTKLKGINSSYQREISENKQNRNEKKTKDSDIGKENKGLVYGRLKEKVERTKRKEKNIYNKAPKKIIPHFEYKKEINYAKYGKLGPVKDYNKQFLASEDDFHLVRKVKFKSDQIKRYHYKKPRIRRAIVRKGENKLFEYEGDNLGVEASHHVYRGSRKLYRAARRISKKHSSIQYKYKRARKSRIKKEEKLNAYVFQEEHPEARSRLRQRRAYKQQDLKSTDKQEKQYKKAQKKQYRKKYAKQTRESKNADNIMNAAQKGMKAASKKLLQIIAANKIILLKICLIAFGFIFVFYIFGMAITFVQTILTEMMAGIYQADYSDMTESESIFKYLEAKLEERIKNIETEYPGYDEYRYELGEIGHDPNLLLSYLGAKYINFTSSECEAELTEIFNLMYQLELVEEIEIRTRMVEREDPITGKLEWKEEEYEYYILNVILTVHDLREILEGRLTEEEKKQFDIYQETGGGQNIFQNPLAFDWHSSITSQFGYRIHPISGDLKFHSGVDIAAPKGSPIFSSMEGSVIKAGENGGYGLAVEIENERGERTKYAHCSKLIVSAGEKVKRGDKIAEVGSTGNSTGNHLHFEYISANGEYLNPLFIISNSARKE